jgi:hypothetical protein
MSVRPFVCLPYVYVIHLFVACLSVYCRYMAAIAEALPTVKYLNLQQNLLTAQGLRKITKGLQLHNVASTGLLHLDLSHNRIGSNGAQVLAKALSFDKDYVLRQVRDAVSDDNSSSSSSNGNGSGGGPGGGGGFSQAAAMRRTPILATLRVLRLRNNNIGEGGTDAICTALSQSKVILGLWRKHPGFEHMRLRLSELDLSRNEVGGGGGGAAATAGPSAGAGVGVGAGVVAGAALALVLVLVLVWFWR